MSNSNKKNPLLSILLFYSGALLFFTVLYLLPFSTTFGIHPIDALFLSASGLSVTGLSTIDISTDLTFVGQILLLIQIQFGGIGIMVFIAYLFVFTGKELSLPQLLVLSADQNQRSIKSIRNITLLILLIAFSFETIGFTILYPSISKLYSNPFESMFATIFHSVSSFTGAGFDLYGDSLISMNTNPIIVITSAVLIFAGIIGFPTIIELFTKRGKKKSLFTKVNLVTHISLLCIGFFVFFILEFSNSFSQFNIFDKLYNSFFLSVTARNGGLTTIDISDVTTSTLILLLFLMFIGASPSSCGGGIRTTTFAVIIAKLWSIIKGKEEAVLFNKSIHEQDVNKSFLILFSFLGIFIFSVFFLAIFERFEISALSFEIMSALTTTGLSQGITGQLHWFSKIWLIFLMFIGRIGVIAWIYLFIKPTKTKTKYIKESISIG